MPESILDSSQPHHAMITVNRERRHEFCPQLLFSKLPFLPQAKTPKREL